MNSKENNKKPFKSDKWLYYQDVKVLKTRIKLTEKDKEKINEFRKFINDKEKNTSFRIQCNLKY